MSRPDGPVLVLGMGNVLLRDEGVGVRVVEALDRLAEAGALELPEAVRFVDGGTLGLDLLPLIEESRALIMVDAIDLRRAPGSIEVIRGDALHGALAGHVSPHQVGVSDLLAAARLMGALPEAVALVGIQPGEIAIGLELSEPVRLALALAIDAVMAELAAFAGSAAPALPPVGSIRTGPGPDRALATAGTG